MSANNLYYVNDAEGVAGWLPIVAPSRSKAHAIYLGCIGMNYRDSEHWTMPVTIQLLATDVELPEGEYMAVCDEIYFECADYSTWLDHTLFHPDYHSPNAERYYGS